MDAIGTLLQFYSDQRAQIFLSPRINDIPRPRPLQTATLAALTLAIAACAPMAPRIDGGSSASASKAQPIAPEAEPPAPGINLSGFPLTYRQGYADGCASASGNERRDGTRFAADGNYRTGWQDGLALCRKRN
jgi:hypothetical protein